MTPKIIELKQEPVALVELSERPIEVIYVPAKGFAYKLAGSKFLSKYIRGVPHDCKIVGILSDLTEEQFAECVDKYDNSNPARHVNYTYKKPNGGMQVSRVTFPWCNKSSDSFYSLLESEKVYTENPIVEPILSLHFMNDRGYFNYTGFEKAKEKWQEAQQRTIDPKRTVVLLRKEG